MRKINRIFSIVFATFSILFSCDGINEGITDPNEIIKLRVLNVQGTEIYESIGDGETLIVLEAEVPFNAADDFQTITFKSSSGDFEGIGQTTHEIRANVTGIARASLKLPLSGGELFLSAEVGKSDNLYKAEKMITLILPSNDEIINLQILNTNNLEIDSAIGDGTTLIRLHAQIPAHAVDDFKMITFKSTDGNFFGTNDKMIPIRANVEGIAVTSLVLPLNSGNLFLTAEVGEAENLYKAKKTITLVAVDQVIDLNFKTLQGEPLIEVPRADGTSIFQLEGTVLVDQDNLNSITFNASKGVFQATDKGSESKNTNEDGIAIVNYIVPRTVGPVFHTAKTGSSPQYVSESNLTFERANADEIILEPTTINMNVSSGNVMTVFLLRNQGKVSLETGVEYLAFQNINNEEVTVGRFTGLSTAFSNEDGKVTTVSFYGDTGDVNFQLPVTIRVTTITDAGDTISTAVNVTVIE